MLRVIHENNLGANHIGTAHEQKLILEAVCNECLQQNNVWAMEGEGAPGLQEMRSVFEEVW